MALSNAFEIAFFGDKPGVFHTGNLLLHVANTFLTYIFIKKLSNDNTTVALWVAALFGLHPLHVESVAWISERKDVLYAFFYLLALIQYLNFKKSKNILNYILLVVFFLLSLLSKSMAVTLPIALIAIDYYLDTADGGKFQVKSLMNKALLFAMSIVFGLLALKSQAAQGYIAEYDNVYNVGHKILFFFYNIGYYLIAAFLPIKMASLHPFPIPRDGSLPIPFYLAPIIVAAAAYILWKSKHYRRLYIFGLLFLFGTLSVVLQVIQIGSAVVAERYTYIPLLGIFFIVATLLYDGFQGKIAALKSIQVHIPKLMMAIIALCAVASFFRLEVWRDGEALWRDNTTKYPESNHYGYYGLANAISAKGTKAMEAKDTILGQKLYYESLEAFNKAIEINPGFSSYYLNRSGTLSAVGKKEEAIKDLDICVRLNNKSSQGYYNRGLYKTDKNEFASAIKDFDSSLSIVPNYTQALFLRALSKKNVGDINGAIADYKAVLAVDPNFPNTHNNMANIYTLLKDYDNAIVYYDLGLKLNPADGNAMHNKAAAYYNKGDVQNACIFFNQAAKLGNPQAIDAIAHICK